MTFRTVEWMQERLHTLNDEIDCLEYEAEKAAADERAKIVAWLRDTQQICEEKMAQKILPLLHKHHAEHCKFSANAIEAGEHLK